MNKIKVCLILAFIAILCCVCQGTEAGTKSTVASSEEASVETIPSEINGFIKADYELYSSLSQTDDESDEEIYIQGTVEQCMEYDSVMGFNLKDDTGNLWMIGIGKGPTYSQKTVEALIGQEVIVFGDFWICTEDGVPGIKIDNEDFYIQVTGENTDMYQTDFAAEREEALLWFEENSSEIFYDGYYGSIRAETDVYAMSTGVVEKVSYYGTGNYYIDFFQTSEEGYEKPYITYEKIYYDEAEKALDFSYGDGIRLYYYINELNDTELYAIEKVDAGFTIDDVMEEYKSNCQEYTYAEIARNPESVRGNYAKLTGEVIQVMESNYTSYVDLRVNITKSEYGIYKDTIYASYRFKSDTEDRILVGDIITIFGKLTGTKTYQSVLGTSITIPNISAEYIELLTE